MRRFLLSGLGKQSLSEHPSCRPIDWNQLTLWTPLHLRFLFSICIIDVLVGVLDAYLAPDVPTYRLTFRIGLPL